MWNRAGSRYPGIVLLIAALMIGVLAACSDDDGDLDDAFIPVGDSNPPVEAEIADDAPAPVDVNADDLHFISEWEASSVPRFRSGEVLDFEPHASSIPNAGTMVLDGEGASAEEVIAFYRGALRELGWQERRVRAHEITARSENASLLVVVTVDDEFTRIMMMLTD